MLSPCEVPAAEGRPPFGAAPGGRLAAGLQGESSAALLPHEVSSTACSAINPCSLPAAASCGLAEGCWIPVGHGDIALRLAATWRRGTSSMLSSQEVDLGRDISLRLRLRPALAPLGALQRVRLAAGLLLSQEAAPSGSEMSLRPRFRPAGPLLRFAAGLLGLRGAVALPFLGVGSSTGGRWACRCQHMSPQICILPLEAHMASLGAMGTTTLLRAIAAW